MDVKSNGHSIHSVKTGKKGVHVVFRTGTVWYPSLEELEIIKNRLVNYLKPAWEE